MVVVYDDLIDPKSQKVITGDANNQVSSTKYFLFPIISQALRVFIVTEFWLSKQKLMHVFLILYVIVYRGIQYITEQLNWINFNLIE